MRTHYTDQETDNILFGLAWGLVAIVIIIKLIEHL